jgi:hypothetical protein
MTSSLEEELRDEQEAGASNDDFVVQQLRRQIHAQKTNKSFGELYVSRSSKPKKANSQLS